MSRPCQTRRHLTPAEFGLFVFIEQITFRSKVLYCDARAIAAEFGNTRKGTIYRLLGQLEKKGWLKKVKPSKRQGSGMFSATEYEPVSHAEWVETHPGKCPVRKCRLDGRPEIQTHLSGNQDRTCPEIENHLSGNPDIDLEKAVLRKAVLTETETERDSQKRLSVRGGLNSSNMQSINDVFEQLVGTKKFEPQRDLTAGRNRQIKKLQAWQQRGKIS